MIYSVKRFSEEEKKGGMGLGTKLALGTAAIGGGLLAGRAGMLGAGVQKGIGTATASIGNKLGMQSLVKDGASTVGKAAKTQARKDLGILAKGTSRADMAYGNSIAREEAKNATQGILDKYSV